MTNITLSVKASLQFGADSPIDIGSSIETEDVTTDDMNYAINAVLVSIHKKVMEVIKNYDIE